MKNVGLCITKPIDEEELKRILNKFGLAPVAQPGIDDVLEFILAIGGDGSVLKAMDAAISHDAPILGYHTGTLGFLTSGDDLHSLLELWTNSKLVIKQRLLLNVSAHIIEVGSDIPLPQYFKVMNEVAIISDNIGSLLINRVDINGKYVTTYKGDGLCISTPSGSTAWNLSSGGPILHPSVEAIILTPMNPFTLSTRPLVVNSNSLIEVEPAGQVIIDGQRIDDDDRKCTKLVIEKYGQNVKLLLPEDHDFYEAIRSKLGWNNNIKH